MTRGRLIARVAAALGLKTDAGSEELQLLQEWANEGVRDFLVETHCRLELGDLTLTTGVEDYRIDQEVLAVDERSLPTGYKVVSLAEIYEKRRLESVGGTTYYLGIQGDLMLVWPSPTSDTTIRYLYVANPTPMTDDAHDTSDPTYGGIPEDIVEGVETYMLLRGSMYDGSDPPLTPQEYAKLYRDWTIKGRSRVRRRVGRALPGMRAGYPK